MNKFTLLLCAVLASITLSTPALAASAGTKELKREIMKLYGDIRMSATGEQLLAENSTLAPMLSKSDNATILAALELQRSKKVSTGSELLSLSADDITVARHKIQIYEMLCMSAKQHPKIYGRYCEEPPYARLYTSYVKNAANLAVLHAKTPSDNKR